MGTDSRDQTMKGWWEAAHRNGGLTLSEKTHGLWEEVARLLTQHGGYVRGCMAMGPGSKMYSEFPFF